MVTRPKRVAAFQDLCCFGRAALGAVIPVLSAMGVQVCPVPTAVLSAHSLYKNYAIRDMTDFIGEQAAHWQKEGLTFDAVFSGFLGSPRQAAIVAKFIDTFGEGALVTIDPVMADNGKIYSSVDPALVPEMKALVKKAALVTPNLTEAALLLGQDPARIPGREELRQWLAAIADMGPRAVVITSAPDYSGGTDTINTAVYENGVGWNIASRRIPESYPGTGDAFTSVVIGSLLQGKSLPAAAEAAASFVYNCIAQTYAAGALRTEGVFLESCLPALMGDAPALFKATAL